MIKKSMTPKSDKPQNSTRIFPGSGQKQLLFRQAALDHLNRDQDHDDLLLLIPRRNRLIWLAALFLALGAAAWVLWP